MLVQHYDIILMAQPLLIKNTHNIWYYTKIYGIYTTLFNIKVIIPRCGN